MINDVPSRVGKPRMHPVLGRIDTAANILAKKVTVVLDRTAPKDLADILRLCCQMGLSFNVAIAAAQGKAAGIFPVDLARVLVSATRSDWELVRRIESPDPGQFLKQPNNLGETLILPE